ncbi:MAG TPA: Holliday junction resolvase RecU, partial [Vicinamibacterales bacterium]|nr:Holliday junction resolvase RecU [Vicinamibacterales bacterium]
FEAWVEVQHEAAKRLGILAHVHHNEPKVRFINGKLQFAEKSVADYTVVLCGEGARTLAVETKSTSAARFARSEVTAKQQEHLQAVVGESGLALLVLEFRAESARHRFAIPWGVVPWETRRSAEAVYLEELIASRYGWRVHPTCYLSKWHEGGPVRAVQQQRRRYPTE